MKQQVRADLRRAAVLLAAFLLWTLAVCVIDVQPIGPEGSSVGFAALNGAFHQLTGVHMTLYTVTDWLGLVPLGIAAGFGLLGLTQLVRRKSLLRVDGSLLALGGFYVLVLAAFLFFEQVIINYRPVLIDGVLEASYPSSTTLLALCVLPTAVMQLRRRVSAPGLSRVITLALTALTVFLVAGRLLSGVHWLTDIIGGVLLSAGLVLLYRAASGLFPLQK
ncbi:MAG: phosphatase PAP2 family protein [Butyricicoccus sp.]